MTTVQWCIMQSASLPISRTILYLGTFYLVGVPTAALLSLKGDYGMQGILIGFLAAEFIVFVAQLLIVSKIDLEKEIHESQLKKQQEEAELAKNNSK